MDDYLLKNYVETLETDLQLPSILQAGKPSKEARTTY